MSRQHRPERKVAAKVKAAVGSQSGTVDGTAADRLAAAARNSVSEGSRNLTFDVPVGDLRTEIGVEGLRQAAIDAGRTPPSDRTLRRWVQQDRIPHADVLQIAQRRASVERLGGVKRVAEITGRTDKSIRRWQRGETKTLRGSAKFALTDLRELEAMQRAGAVDENGKIRKANVVVRATADIKLGDEERYDHTAENRLFNFNGEKGESLNDEDAWAFARALARGDHAGALLVIEAHASINYAAFEEWGAKDGFHFTDMMSMEIVWE